MGYTAVIQDPIPPFIIMAVNHHLCKQAMIGRDRFNIIIDASSSNFVDRSYTKSFDPEIFPSLGELYICDHHYHHSQVLSQIGVFFGEEG